MKFVNMISMHVQSGTHRGFDWWIIADWTNNSSVLMCVDITDAPKLYRELLTLHKDGYVKSPKVCG